jgi:hypothetical protein
LSKTHSEQEAGEHSENETFGGIHNTSIFSDFRGISMALTTGFSEDVPGIR